MLEACHLDWSLTDPQQESLIIGYTLTSNKEGSMAKIVRKHWITEDSYGLARRDRRSCDYEAYIPDPLTRRDLMFEATTTAELADAEREIAIFDAHVSTLVGTEALARILLRAECFASS